MAKAFLSFLAYNAGMSKAYMPSPDQYLNSLDDQKHQVKPPKQRAGWRKILKRTILSILAIIGVALVVGIIIIWQNLAKLSINPLDFGPLSSDNGRTNILVMGIGDPGHAGENLSDTMMVISLDHSGKQVAMISLPRDLRVNVPGYGFNKINTANSLGGPQLAEQTVSNTLGIPIQYYIKTDFTGLKQAIDAVGGIDVTVTERLTDPEYPCAANEGIACGIDIKPGTYHMDGTLALQYARCRKGTCGNDFGRAARQQDVIQKLRDKIVSPGFYLNPAADTALLAAISNNSQTDLSVNDMAKVGWEMKHATRTVSAVFSTAPGGYLRGDPAGSSDLLPTGGSFGAIQDYVANVFTKDAPPAPQ
jgi:LCP family protein required for cell wall assembly